MKWVNDVRLATFALLAVVVAARKVDCMGQLEQRIFIVMRCCVVEKLLLILRMF